MSLRAQRSNLWRQDCFAALAMTRRNSTLVFIRWLLILLRAPGGNGDKNIALNFYRFFSLQRIDANHFNAHSHREKRFLPLLFPNQMDLIFVGLAIKVRKFQTPFPDIRAQDFALAWCRVSSNERHFFSDQNICPLLFLLRSDDDRHIFLRGSIHNNLVNRSAFGTLQIITHRLQPRIRR